MFGTTFRFRIPSLQRLELIETALLVFGIAQAAESQKPAAAEKWVTLTGCHLVTEASRDGDSFHVKYGHREFIFRLYFVDAPEVDDSFVERNREQSQYFGVTADENRKAGEAAKALTAGLLKKPFVVSTRWQNAMGRSKLPRYYGMVEVGGEDLAEVLVRRGLARVKGAVANLPSGEHAKPHMERLRQLEQEAKAKRVGVWAHSKKAAD